MGLNLGLGLGLSRVSGGAAAFSIADLFSGGQDGTYISSEQLSSLWQEAARTTQVAADGDPVGYVDDLSGNGSDWPQAVALDRPTYKDTPGILFNKTNQNLQVTVPVGGWTGTMVLGTDLGTASYGVSIPAGTFTLPAASLYMPGARIISAVIRNGALSGAEKANAEAAIVASGAGPLAFSGASSIGGFRQWSFLTEMPVVDTSNVTSLDFTWRNCTGLTSFPLLDLSSCTSFSRTWQSCSSLTGFPDGMTFPAATYFGNTFRDCPSLTNFPANAFDDTPANGFSDAFQNTALSQTSVDNILVSINTAGTSSGTLTLNTGTIAPPSATGLAAKTALEGRGWTVSVAT